MSTRPNVTASVGNAPDAEFNNVRVRNRLSAATLLTQSAVNKAAATDRVRTITFGATADFMDANDQLLITADNIVGGYLVITGQTGRFTGLMPSAATLYSKWPNNAALRNYDTLPFTIINHSDTGVWLQGVTNVTMDKSQQGDAGTRFHIIGPTATSKMEIVCTDNTASAPVFQVYRV